MTVKNTSLKRILSTKGLVLFGLAYMVPLGIFTTYGQVTVLSEGRLPLAYLITIITILFTALSYCHMTRSLPLAGSAYSYVRTLFGSELGFLVGWAQILDYLFIPILNYLVIGLYLNEVFPDIPSDIFILAAIISVTTLNIIGVRVLTSVNFILISSQIFFIVVFLFLGLSDIELNMEDLLRPIDISSGTTSSLFSSAAILCLAFLGFDAIATMAEDTDNPKKNLPKAIITTVLTAGFLFIIISYVGHLVYPDWKNLIPIQDTAGVYISEFIGGAFMAKFFLATYLTGVYASAMSAQTSVSRIFFAMGREGVLPKKIFYRLHNRYKTPFIAIIIVACLSLTSLKLDLNLVVSMISFGALVTFTFVNISVIKLFIVDQKKYQALDIIKYGVFPLFGIFMCIWLWTSLDSTAFRAGVSWIGFGVLYLLYLTRLFTKPAPSISHDEIEEIIK
ncbi:APC family permease [Thorsellia kenyensis]|uniref:APC family permease n=1 Tax=Thorsellia kenyensis TaxID=1549888 RepID=A0ABV6CBI5_9GAMM